MFGRDRHRIEAVWDDCPVDFWLSTAPSVVLRLSRDFPEDFYDVFECRH